MPGRVPVATDHVLWLEEAELVGNRWDPGFWDPRLRDPLAGCPYPIAELGDFIPPKGITYGRILPGRRPPLGDGPLYITQKAIKPTGVNPLGCVHILEGCPWDQPRLRLEPGDLLLPRSGVGTLAKGLMTLYLEDGPAVVDCFTDRVTLDGYRPEVAVLFLRCPAGWLQIYRMINGVGPPNISFDEVRSLKVPVLPDDEAEALAERYEGIHRAHRAWIARIAAVPKPARDLHCGELRREAERQLAAAIRTVGELVTP